MKEVPEKLDLERISKACDKVLAYMRNHYVDNETLDAIGKLCAFVNRVKKDIEWIESMMDVMKAKEEMPKDGPERNQESHFVE